MLLAELVATSTSVAATRSRKAKVAALAETLARVEPAELEVVVSYLGGALRQRRTGLGWRGVSDLPPPAAEPSLTVLEVHEAFEAMSPSPARVAAGPPRRGRPRSSGGPPRPSRRGCAPSSPATSARARSTP